jgi:ribosome-binding protein aMBF1 (putative translation factor)
MPVMTKTPNGEDIVILSRQEYDDLTEDKEDIADRAILLAAMARREAGEVEYLTSEEVDEYLAATTPMAFWRKRRGLSEAAISEKTGLSPNVLSEIEAGRASGDAESVGKIAAALGVTQDQVIND